MIKLTDLEEKYDQNQIEYFDIVNYEIARENICNYIFHLSKKKKTLDIKEQDVIEHQIKQLVYYREELKITDKKNVQRVLKELIPQYKAELEKEVN